MSKGEGARLVVVGAGAAGIATSIAAARAGAQVTLVESTNASGGTVTKALIHTLGGIFNANQELINDGIVNELVNRLMAATSRVLPRQIGKTWCLEVCPNLYHAITVNWLKEEPRIRLLCGADVTTLTIEGRRVVRYEVAHAEESIKENIDAVVDATGTAEVVRMIDPRCVLDDEQRAAGGLILRLRGVRPGSLAFPKSVSILNKIREAANVGRLPPGCGHTWIDRGIHEDEVFLKLFVPLHGDWRSSEKRRQIEHQARESADLLVAFLLELAEFKNATRTQTGGLGIRDGGRIRGDYYLTEDDVRRGRRFADAACRACWPIEYWHSEKGLQLEYLQPDQFYEIPLRSLKVRGLINVWAAGKCLSADHKAQSSARVAGHCWAMGEAVGKAAAGTCT